MVTAAPGYLQGARRTFGPPSLAVGPIGGGTAALTDDAQLRQLMALLQQFYAAQAIQESPAGQAQEQEIINDNVAPGQEGPAVGINPGQGAINPETLAILGQIFGAGGQIFGNPNLSELGGFMGLGGNLAQSSPEGAMIGLAGVGANLAGANPVVTTALQAVANSLLGGPPLTGKDLVGMGVNALVNKSILAPINAIMGLATGKNIGTIVKGMLTPVETINPTDAIVQQANQQAEAQNKDPMDVLMTLTNAFGTAPPPPVTPAAPSDISTPPPSQLAELAISMIGMPAPPAELGTPSGLSTSPDAQMAALAESLSGMPAPAAPAAPSAPSGDIGLDISSISSGIAGLGMDIGFGDIGIGGDVGSNDGAPSSPSDGDGTAY
jgi:hypothetical protein